VDVVGVMNIWRMAARALGVKFGALKLDRTYRLKVTSTEK